MAKYKQWGRFEEIKTETELDDLTRKQLKAALDRMDTREMGQDMEIYGAINILNLVCMVAFASDPALLEACKCGPS